MKVTKLRLSLQLNQLNLSKMATFLNKWLKLAEFDIDPNSQNTSSTLSKYFKHWLKTLTDFLKRIWAASRHEGFAAPNWLEVLCAYVSGEVYELIEGRDSYNIAIAKLKEFFVKTSYVIFSRHFLATRKQKAGKPQEEFL